MVSISFHFSDEEIDEYSLGDIEISANGKTLSSKGDSKNLMMVFISMFELSDGIVRLIHKKSEKSYEFVGTDSSFRLLFDYQGDSLSITHPPQQDILKITETEIVSALRECWKEIDRHIINLDPKSSVYLSVVASRNEFQEAFISMA
jgi:hypothetical protein